jgi:hypothetical protein
MSEFLFFNIFINLVIIKTRVILVAGMGEVVHAIFLLQLLEAFRTSHMWHLLPASSAGPYGMGYPKG